MAAVLLVALLVVPLLEIYVILQVADVIGGWQTVLVLVAESVFGTWLVRREGRRTWRVFSHALEESRSPTREVADGALVIVGGTLLLTPGFLSDILGFFVLLPFTRPLARRLLLRWAARRMGGALFGGVGLGGPGSGGVGFGGPRFGAPTSDGAGRQRRRRSPGGPGSAPDRGVIEGEVVDERIERPGHDA